MTVYPSSIPYMNPVSITVRQKTLITAFDEEGEENRKQKWIYPKRDVTMSYQALSKDDAEAIYEYYIKRGGSYGSFSWFESSGLGTPRTYTSEYVGTGDSTTLIFNLPAVESSASHTVYVAGTSANSTNYTFNAGGGPDNEDKITFIASTTGGPGPPTSTEKVTYSFTGRLKIRSRFAEDNLTYQTMYDRLVNTGVKLKGLLNS
jgi:hypothetical protein